MAAKGLIQIQPIINALATANCLSSCQTGAVYDISTGSSGRMLYAGMHLVSTGLDGTPSAWTISLQSATACAFSNPTTRFTFTSQTCAGAQVATPIAYPAASTECQYWRAMLNPTTTTDFRLGLIWVGTQ